MAGDAQASARSYVRLDRVPPGEQVGRFVRAVARRLAVGAGLVASAPLVLLIVLLRPIVLIRFGALRHTRIGHLAVDVEAYLCARDAEHTRSKTVDIIGCSEPVCNTQLRDMWARVFRISPGAGVWAFLERSCRFWTGGNTHSLMLGNRIADHSLLFTTSPHLTFSQDDLSRGQRLLLALGVPDGAPWVCVHNRDSAYLNTMYGSGWSYHDYRDFDVDSLGPACDELVRRGYYVVRMGAVVTKKLDRGEPRIIDYALSGLRSDFGDLFLEAHCTFHLGACSGLCWVPGIFRRRVSLINVVPLSSLSNVLCATPAIFKQFRDKAQGRFLSVRELAALGLIDAGHSLDFERAGVEVISNSPEDIRDLVEEVDDRGSGRWSPLPGDEELQERFRSMIQQHLPAGGLAEVPRVGARFLRKHPYLFD